MRHLLHGSMVETEPAQIKEYTRISSLEYCSLRMSTLYFSHFSGNFTNIINDDYWIQKLKKADGFMFVIDASMTVSDSLAEILLIFANMAPPTTPLLVFFNKMDIYIFGNKSLSEIMASYRLDEYNTNRDALLCQPCVATGSGKGVYEGLEWLFEKVANNGK